MRVDSEDMPIPRCAAASARAFPLSLRVVLCVVLAASAAPGGLVAQNLSPSERFAETLHEVRALRGLAVGKSLEIEVAKRAQLAAVHGKSWPSLREDGRAFASLGVLPAKLDVCRSYGDAAARMLEVYYDDRKARVILPADSKKLGRYVQKLLGAYAISVATDTVRYKLTDKLRDAKSFDERFVLLALRSGAAMTTMGEWAIAHREGWTMPERLGLRKWEEARTNASIRGSRLFAIPLAASVLGRNFVMRGKGGVGLIPKIASGSSKRIESIWRDAPTTSEQILHPEKFWPAKRRDGPVTLRGEVELVQELAKMAGGTLKAANTLGEIGCAIAIHRPVRMQARAIAKIVGTTRYWSSRATQGWGGDRLFAFGRGEEASTAWITLWDTKADAKEFAGAFMGSRGKRQGFEAAVRGTLVVFASGKLSGQAALVADRVVKHGAEKAGKAYAIGNAEAAGPGR